MTDPLLLHLTPEEIELWAQGLGPATRDAHLAQCAQCRTIAERERKLIRDHLEVRSVGGILTTPGPARRASIGDFPGIPYFTDHDRQRAQYCRPPTGAAD